VFTTRRGGHSRGPYESLNLGRLTGDRRELVERNYALIENELGVRLARVRQVHGADVVRLIAPVKRDGPLPRADGQATASRGIAPTVLTADCLPIALAGGGRVAMLHAGWRGLAAGVIEEGVRALRELGNGESPHAAIGPCAGPCCYEVGEDVHAVFAERFPHARRGPNLDLPAIARSRLEAAGAAVVYDVGLCTICSPRDLFYSHHRDRGVTGRQAGLVWLT
jgi:YfiH family protein